MAKTFEDSPQGRRSYTQYSQTERRTSGVYGDTTKKRGESLRSKFTDTAPPKPTKVSPPVGSSSGEKAGNAAKKGASIGSASGESAGNATSPTKERKPIKRYQKFTDDDVDMAESKVYNAEAKDGKYSDDEMEAARVVRTARGQRKNADGKSYGRTGDKNAETAKLDDYITLMAKGTSGMDEAPAAAKSQGGTSSSGSPRSSVSSSVRSTPSRPSGGTARRESPVKGAGSVAPSRAVSGGQVSASSVPSRASKARMKDSFRDSLIREDAANRANAKLSPSSGTPTVQGGRAGSDPKHPKGIIGDRNAQIGAKQPHPMQYEEAYAANAYGGAGMTDDIARGAAAGLRSASPRQTTGRTVQRGAPPTPSTSSVPPSAKPRRVTVAERRAQLQERIEADRARNAEKQAANKKAKDMRDWQRGDRGYKPTNNGNPTAFEKNLEAKAKSEARLRETHNELKSQQRGSSGSSASSDARLSGSSARLRARQQKLESSPLELVNEALRMTLGGK